MRTQSFFFVPQSWQDEKLPLFLYRAQKLPSLLFYLQTWRYRHCWSQQFEGRVSCELRDGPLCGSVVEHRSAKSEGLSFDSSYYIWGILSHARHKTKNILPNFFNELKSYHLSFSIYESVKHVSLRTELTNYMPKICGGCHKRMKW